MRFVATTALILALTACERTPIPSESSDTQSVDAGGQDADAAPDPDAKATGGEDAQKSRTGPEYTSAFTKFDLATCETLTEEREEGSSATYRCPGYQGIPIFVQEGDGRFDMDAGADNKRFQTLSAFNDFFDTIEWRMKDGKPFAIIVRYRDATMENAKAGRTVLAVEKIGGEGTAGCRIAQIAGNTDDANARARAMADERAEDFACIGEPVYVGDAR
ncbi:hypothetical protein [Qipengyuania sp. JC766]|uniref:hypothetical protein n=1 Tax=Qipengyuania sp. JC766 TaxID=3232139 RepID=UPI0034583D9E